MANNNHADLNTDATRHYPRGFEGAGNNTHPRKNASGLYVWENGLIIEKVTISSAEMLDIHDTPKELIAAPGANKVIRVLDILNFLDFNSAAYVTGANKFTVEYGANNYEIFSLNDALITSAADRVERGVYSTTEQLGVNEAVVATMATADPTDGDSPLYMWLTYFIQDLTA